MSICCPAVRTEYRLSQRFTTRPQPLSDFFAAGRICCPHPVWASVGPCRNHRLSHQLLRVELGQCSAVFHMCWGKEGIRAVLVDKDRKQHLGLQTCRMEVVVQLVPRIISKEVEPVLGFTGRDYRGEGQVAMPFPVFYGAGHRRAVHLRAGLRILLSARCWPFQRRAALGGRLTVCATD